MTRRTQILILAGAILLGASARAQEKVEFRDSTSYELPKPTQEPHQQGRVYKSGKESPNLDGGFMPVAPAPNSALAEKKLKEWLDKKKNWIFVDPYEKHYDSKTEEFLKGEKGTGLFSHRWMQDQDNKSEVEKFLSEKKGNRPDDKPQKDGASDRNNDPNSRESIAKEQDDSGKDSNAIFFGGDSKPSIAAPEFTAPTALSSMSFEDRFPSGIGAARPFLDQKSDLSPTEKEKVRKADAAHEAEFGKFLQSLAPSATTRSDPLNNAIDFSHLENSLGASRHANDVMNFGKSDASGLSFGANSSLSASVPTFDRSFSDDFGSRASKAPSFVTQPLVPPPSQTPAFAPSAFELPFPHRKF